MRIVLLAAAEADFDEALRYYASKEPELSMAFTDEVLACLDCIQSHPDAWNRVSSVARRALVKRFPYAIFFRQDRDEIVVAAILHLKRNPKAWKSRL